MKTLGEFPKLRRRGLKEAVTTMFSVFVMQCRFCSFGTLDAPAGVLRDQSNMTRLKQPPRRSSPRVNIIHRSGGRVGGS